MSFEWGESFKDLWPRFAPLLLLAALALAYFGQLRYDTWRFFDTPTVQDSFNNFIEPEPLKSPTAKAASLGATNFLSDIYWLELIQYYGGGDPYGTYRQLPALYQTITDLSPKFLAAYQSGLLVLPQEKFTDQAIALGEKGQQNLPKSWEIPYYEGLVYHVDKKDYLSAARQFQIAAAKPGAPAITKYFAGLYYKEAGSRQTAYVIFQTVYQTTTDPFVKDRAQKQIGHLGGLFALQDAVSAFQQKLHRNPKSFDELIAAKIIPALPVSPLGLKYTYDAVTGAVSDTK
ncbi:MAG TPA: hypothetical protein VLE93_03850 [Candidatus Saccharimonadales bacterium]|nr:hypothetical protein [Candidatus Saccharimonadales bacterium]